MMSNRRGVIKKPSSSRSPYGKPSLKQRIGLALTGADPISNTLSRAEEKLREKGSKLATNVANKLKVPKAVRKAVSGAAKGVGVATSAARLVGKVANPLFIPQMAAKQALGLGMTLPGSKYIGPKNPMTLGKPTSKADAAAFEHDKAYDNYIKQGIPAKKVYGSYSKADKVLMNKADVTTPSGLAAYLGMASKKLFQPKLKE